ncbi:MAG: tripartite tricarboxylate transporter substrate binding protein [Burkholderiales bacterium]
MKYLLGVLALSLPLVAPPGAAVAAYPERPIRFLVGVVPGGAADMLARALGQRLSERLKQQVIVDNRPGANQTIAAEMTAKATPDGHTILIVTSGHAINPSLYRLRYDSVRDFSTIGLVAMVPNVLVVHPSVPARTVKEFIAFARGRPGELSFGSSGAGSPSHLSGELFQMFTQVKLTHVPYKGQGQAIIDLLGGHLKVAFPSIPASIQHIKTGKMIALGVTPRQRSSALPDVPTLEQAGVAGYEVSGWYGVLGPARIPGPVVARLNGEFRTMLQEPDVRDVLSRQGADPLTSTPEEFARTIAVDITKWAKVVKAAGVKVE